MRVTAVSFLCLFICCGRSAAVLSTAEKQESLDFHNDLRRNEGASGMLLMQWDYDLAEFAQTYADECVFEHSSSADRMNLVDGVSWVGENLYVTSASQYEGVARAAIQAWYDEKEDYDYDSGSCAPGRVCGHYTQVVWARSYLVGCGVANCTRIYSSSISSGTLVVCNYAPGGNFVGQLPYTVGEACSDCPTQASNCVDGLCSDLTSPPVVPPSDDDNENPTVPRVTNVDNRFGSIGGGTRITIGGWGFSEDQYSFDDPTRGNRVFLTRGTTTIECQVLTYYTTTTRIVCDTSPAPDGEGGRYAIDVTIDGKSVAELGGIICNRCYFDYNDGRTPKIEYTRPMAGTPGTPVTLVGRIFTNNVDDLEVERHISRLFVGDEICDPINAETGDAYENGINGVNGNVTCLPSTGSRLDSMNATIVIASTFGNSIIEQEDYSLDNNLRPYLYQTHADITGVSPTEGSVSGGTLITIYGEYFDPNADSVEVLVGGVPCDIQSVNTTEITCVTGPSPPDAEYYPGGRGLLREVYMRDNGAQYNLNNFRAYADENPTNFSSYSEIAFATNRRPPAEFGEDFNFNSRYRGYFVPPHDGLYTFYIRSDDNSRLFLSPNISTEHAEIIADAPTYTRERWDFYDSQKSVPLELKSGQAYYIEALHHQVPAGGWHVEFGAKFHNTTLTSSDVYGEHEEQRIQISSEIRKETHEIIMSIEPMMLNVTINGTGSPFTLRFGSNETVNLTNSNSASQFDSAVTAIIYGATGSSIRVTRSVSSGITVFQIVFFEAVLRTATLQVGTYNSSIIDVTIATIQMGRFPDDLILSLPVLSSTSSVVRSTMALSLPSEEDVVEDELHSIVSVSCTKTSTSGEIFWSHTYDNSPGRVWGTLDNTIDPMCGRYSLKNPTFIYVASITRDEITQTEVGDIPWEIYNYLCFSYRGYLPTELRTQTYVTEMNGRRNRNIYLTLPSDEFAPSPESWTRRCINMFEYFTVSSSYADTGILFETNRIFFASGTDFWIDEVSIQQGENQILVDAPPARPNGIFIDEIDVDRRSISYNGLSVSNSSKYTAQLYSYTVEYTVHDCMIGIPVLSYTATNDDLITIQRTIGATSGVTGTFTVEAPQYATIGSYNLQPIPFNATASEVENWLEQNYDIGDIDVTTGGMCDGRWWDIKWLERGGDQDPLAVNGSGLIQVVGNNASVAVETLVDGGVFMRPLRGDMLRLPKEYPQVEVIFNKIPSSCKNDNCSFYFMMDMTPTVLSVSPTVGQAGTIVTITGANFSSNTTENSVYIGDVICPVIEANETFIRCMAGPNVAGTHDVNVLVASSGFSISNETFEYTLTIDRLNSTTSGSIGGGTLVTILGMGFPIVPEQDIKNIVNEFAFIQFMNESDTGNYSDIGNYSTYDFIVFLNNSICAIVKSNYSHITCISGPHPAAVVDVIVNVNDIIDILENAFEYSNDSTPIVTDIMPTKLPVHSYSVITIKGLGFGNLGSGAGSDLREMLLNDTSEIMVIINGMLCVVEQYSDVMIVCRAPPQGPSTYPMFVLVEGVGFAVQAMALNSEDAFLYPPIFYELQVFRAFPSIGSILGGSLLTIYGSGFSSDPYEVEVDIGNLPCEIKSTNSTHISCETTAITRNVPVQPNIVGSTLVWNPDVVVIQIGDTVQWSWVGLSLDLFQVANGSSVYDGQGFRSERIENGNFSYTFTQAGTYYYASNLDNFVQLRGTVIVEESTNITFPISVKVNNYFAEYYITNNQTVSDSSTCRGEFFPEVVTFTYATCATPVVTSVTPLTSTVQDEITISGQGFSTTPTMNSVTIGTNYICNVINSNETSISCLLDPDSMLPIDKPLTIIIIIIIIYIPGYDAPSNGIALNDIPVADQSIVFYPIIANFTPTEGSFQGGLDLYIAGSGFDTDTAVSIGGRNCAVNSLSYSNIICTVPAFVGDGDITVDEYLAEIVVTTSGVNARCGLTQCNFTYSGSNTPIIDNIFPRSFFGDGTTSIGLLFNNSLPPLPVNITIGMYPCEVINASDITASITCTFNPIEAGSYMVRVFTPVGEAMFSSSSMVSSVAQVSSLMPNTGSAEGGNTITISGYGFSSQTSNNSVRIGSEPCQILYSSYTTIRCVVPPGSLNTNATVVIVINNINLGDVFYYYGESPQISAIYPMSGQTGDNVTITGSLFSNATSDNIVTIGGAICNAYSASESEINCTLGGALAGTYSVAVLVNNIGKAAGSVTFTYVLRVSELLPMEGSFAGKNILTIYGAGFEPAATFVKICDQSCIPTNDPPSLTTLQCEIPARTYNGSDVICNVTVSSMSSTVMITNGYTYMYSLTAQVTTVYPAMGGTAGGTTITIIGSGFGSSNTTVSIGDSSNRCNISDINDTVIVCQTGAFGRTLRAEVLVNVDGNFAESGGLTFFYVDLWSSNFTWGGLPPPVEGDFVVVPRGQTLAIDVHTPILSFLLIQGGSVMFLDEGDVSLHTQFVLITDNGSLQVGTEEEPFTNKAEIVLYGHVLSTELPIYGAKTLAVRHGTLDLHGKKLNVTWTRLDATANPGDTTIILKEPVPWEIGGKIVIASTSYSQRENEEVEIIGIDSTGTILTIDPPLQYRHISVKQTIAGKFIDTSAEVGYLTRNVVFRGNRITEWDAPIPACPEEFRPGQFDVQTCFQGRFGAETASDQFGGQIMLHAAVMNENRVIGRIEYVEVTHAGQAFRLGRYPIHFHLNGDVTGSYVRGCGIHHTFNRAVTIHGVNNLLVENNVAYNIMGHAYFLEDGVEVGTIIQDNLGVFVRSSSSLLNVDVTPATFWVVNPNNIVRRNAAAGGSHFGFWYRLERFPSGPSFTTSICPQNVPLGEFTDNSAHSMGWYGLWVFQAYFPKVNGACNGGIDEPAIFNNLLAWKNNRGVEFHETVGALQVHNSTMLDNEVAGVEITAITGQWGGAVVKNVLIVGHSDVNSDNSDFCTTAGFRAPHSYYLSVSNVTFVNFDRPGCSAVLACSHCRALQGGFLTRYNDITLIDSPNLSGWQWTYEHVHRDLDGSLTGIVNGSLLPYTGLLPSGRCSMHPASSTTVGGSLCDASVDFVRIAIHSVLPSSIRTRTLFLTNQFGTSNVNYVITRLTGPSGYMAIIPKGYVHYTRWDSGGHLSNISYSLIISGLEEDEYFWISRNYTQPVDGVVINGVEQNSSNIFPDPAIHSTGTWYFNNLTNDVTYLIKGRPNGAQFTINFRTFRCFYPDCIVPTPPPTQEPGAQNMTRWSDNSTWANGRLPQEGESVVINNTQHVMIDIPIPRLASITIQGTLELLDELNHTIGADYILIEGGALIAGSPEKPFKNIATFVLYGNQLSPEIILPPRGPILGAKAIGVFGKLILHGQERAIIWTHLAETAAAGTDTIEVIGMPDWNVGDEIVIASTSFEMLHTEKFQILSISQSTITLNGTLQYKHLGEETTVDGHIYKQRAEVGLLTRNIKIQSGNLATTDEESFGCRILVGSYLNAFRDRMVGSAEIDGVEIAYCGQEGYPDSFDPRYSFAVLNTRIGADETTYIRRSSIHDGYNSGIGAFGSDGVIISDNVIHRTVGPSVVLEGSHHILNKTMATVALFPGTYRGIDDPQNFKWTANFKLIDTTNLTLLGNAAAGGGKVGFHVDGEPCDSPVVNGAPRWEANVAHSTLHGIHVGYDDGLDTCLQLSYFTIYSCYHYGIFTYSRSGVYMENNVLIDNNAGMLLNVFSPPALSHQTSTKTVTIKDTVIVGASPYLSSEDDTIVPEVSSHERSFSPMFAPGGGHIGIILSSFLSGRGHFPKSSWPSITSYPAISGLTTLDGITFINFADRDTKRDFAFVSNPISEDCQHPTYVSNAKLINVDNDLLYFNRMPNLGSVNPSDCVDLDCDAQKHILIKDLDGSLLNRGAGGSIISQAEFEWDGDPRRGLGDHRIPTVLIADPSDGTPIPVDDLFPLKGIVRGGNRSESNCIWMSSWNAYSCTGLNHLMFIFESLDADTEVRRLSPFALAANGFIDILNGPQDHGWCGGYTCQERISTLYGIIAAGLNYEIALSSTNPQNMRFHLLNAKESDTIRIAFIYTNPQRLDVYYGDSYVNPTNVRIENGETVYNSKDPNLPFDQFQPTINDQPGANFYERSEKRLYFILRGNTPITIRTAPVVQLALNLAPVTVDEFFEENLVFNLATLLGIDQSRIRIVNVISEASNRKRQAVGTSVEIEIGNPPPVSNGTVVNNDTVTNNQTTVNSTIELDFVQLENITSMVAEAIQTGQLDDTLNITVISADIQPPEPPPVDFTGGVRATNTTGGPQPGEVDNNTLTYEDVQNTQRPPEVTPVTLTIPTELRIISQPIGGIEGLSLTPLPILAVYDREGEIVTNLGIGDPWVLSIVLMSNSASSVQVLPNSQTVFTGGYANLTNFSISHPGNGYILMFNITDPPVGFTAQTAPFDVATRELLIRIVNLPESGSTTLPLYPYPTVELLDKGIQQRVVNLGWRGRRWFAKLQVYRSNQVVMDRDVEFDSNNASAMFTNVLLSQPGQYLMEFTAYTSPQSEVIVMRATKTITIRRLPSAMMRFVLNVDFDLVIGSNQEAFIQSITSQLSSILSQVTIYNVTVSRGSIVVTFNVQSENEQDVQDAVNTFIDTNFSIIYNGTTFVAVNRTAEFTGVTGGDDDDDDNTHTTIIIIACVCGGCLLLLFLIVLLCVISWWCRKKRHTKVWKVHVKPGGSTHDNTKHYEIRDIYWQVSQSHVEENEYVSGPGVVRDFNTDEPVNEENSNDDAVALTRISRVSTFKD